MQDLQQIFARYRKYILFLLSFYVLGWGFTPYPSVFLGLILGTGISLYNLWVMVRKTVRFGQAVAEGKAARSIGTFSRMASAGLAVIIAINFPDKFHLISTIVGLMTFYIVIMIDLIIHTLKRNRGEER
jgi:ATP synthase protein I